jgi:uncharacterized protein (TIGR03435 family)
MGKLFLLAIGLCAATAVGAAQDPADQAPESLPSFEVASVRVNKTAEMGQFIRRQPGGGFSATNMPLRGLIQFAYQMRPFQVEGAPDWAGSTRYDIAAKAGRDLPLTPLGTVAPEMLMLRSLLAERFKLKVRFETREMPIYELRLARDDGRLGPNLSVTTADCQALMKAAMGRGGPPPPPPSATERMQCGMRIGPGRMSAGSFPMSEFANTLGTLVQRTVVDRTGLAGNYDAEMTFTMEQMAGPGGAPLQPPPGAPPPDPDAPSIFTALQEQLGLKLESAKGPVRILVVEHVEPAVDD